MTSRLFLTAAIATLASCASRAAPSRTHAGPLDNVVPSARYVLQPVRLHGPEGRHSASHSMRHVRGSLELRDGQVTVTLDHRHDRSYVHCPATPAVEISRQACAAPSAQPSSTTSTQILTGTATWSNGTMTTTVRAGEARLTLTCTPDFFGLACAVDPETTVFGALGPRPARLAFATPGPKHFELRTRTLQDGSTIAGTVDVDAASFTVAIARPGQPPVALPGELAWTPAGLVLDARTSPTRTLVLICAPTSSTSHLTCDVTADRSVLGEPDHVYGTLELRAGS